MTEPAAAFAVKTDIVVIGAGQAGLSSAYHLRRLGIAPGRGFVVLDQNAQPGGAWQHRWPSLTLSTVNRIHDLPGLAFASAIPDAGETV
jgi:cation diffusion facilitator CzcD-associated flavoprotein CzcO